VIKVDKFLDSTGLGKDPTVKTRWYSYNVSIRGYGNLVRYDNQDDTYLRNQHYDEHHLHIFNWVTGIENARSPYWIGDKNWPTLGQVIHNVELWYWTYKDELPSSENYSEIGARTSPPMSGAS
jgi:hypothetical protein